MGLAERRAIKAVEDTQFPEFKKSVSDAIGKDTAINVHWSSLAIDGYDHLYAEAMPKVFF